MNNILATTLRSRLTLFAWILSAASCSIALIVWGQYVNWDIASLTAYSWFPLFGLVAFTLMWGHYIVTAARRLVGADAQKLVSYYRATSWIVLVALLLHPGLLIWQLWVDGLGLPPSSYLTHYVAPELGWVAGLGSLSLMTFLAYEFWRWFERKPWWRWVGWASEFAMIAIFYHGWRLGSQLQGGWFQVVWLLYGVSLVVAFAYLHWAAYHDKSDPEPWRTRGAITGAIVCLLGLVAFVGAII